MAGYRPVCEMQYDAFSYPCLDQLITHVGRYRWRTGGKMTFPITIRMPYGGGVRAPELHDDSPETYYVHTPGIKVAIPVDARRREGPAGRGDPRSRPGRDPRAEARLPDRARRGARGRARRSARARRGSRARGRDVTLVAYGAMVPVCERAADELDASVEVLDLRSLKPLDEAALLASAAKTGRVVLVQEAPRTCGYAAELAAILAEKALLDLQAPVAPRHRLRRPVPVLADRGRVHAVRRARRRRRALAARVLVARHELPLDASVLHGYFSRELEPVLTVEPGDSIAFSVPNAGWHVGPDEPFASRSPELDTGHALAGPIEVRGARAGQVLAVRSTTSYPGPGASRSAATARLDWELDEDVGRAAGRSVRLAPFLGVLGMPPDEPGVHSTIPPRRFGGNIDCKELVAGTTLYLPIPVDGARFSAGDGHAAQGDGEVSGTAIEAPVDAQVTLDVRDDLVLEWPIARIDGAWLTFGFDEHLGARRRGSRSTACVDAAGARARARRALRRAGGAIALSERLRLWLERGASGYRLRDAATGEPVRWEDPRIRVVAGGRCQLPPRGARRTRRSIPAGGSRSSPEPDERARPERGRDLERGADAAGRLRPRRGRSRARRRRAGALALARRGRSPRPDRPCRRLDRDTPRVGRLGAPWRTSSSCPTSARA